MSLSGGHISNCSSNHSGDDGMCFHAFYMDEHGIQWKYGSYLDFYQPKFTLEHPYSVPIPRNRNHSYRLPLTPEDGSKSYGKIIVGPQHITDVFSLAIHIARACQSYNLEDTSDRLRSLCPFKVKISPWITFEGHFVFDRKKQFVDIQFDDNEEDPCPRRSRIFWMDGPVEILRVHFWGDAALTGVYWHIGGTKAMVAFFDECHDVFPKSVDLIGAPRKSDLGPVDTLIPHDYGVIMIPYDDPELAQRRWNMLGGWKGWVFRDILHEDFKRFRKTRNSTRRRLGMRGEGDKDNSIDYSDKMRDITVIDATYDSDEDDFSRRMQPRYDFGGHGSSLRPRDKDGYYEETEDDRYSARSSGPRITELDDDGNSVRSGSSGSRRPPRPTNRTMEYEDVNHNRSMRSSASRRTAEFDDDDRSTRSSASRRTAEFDDDDRSMKSSRDRRGPENSSRNTPSRSKYQDEDKFEDDRRSMRSSARKRPDRRFDDQDDRRSTRSSMRRRDTEPSSSSSRRVADDDIQKYKEKGRDQGTKKVYIAGDFAGSLSQPKSRK